MQDYLNYLDGYVGGYEDCHSEFQHAIPKKEEVNLEGIANLFITLLHVQRKKINSMKQALEFDECLNCFEEICEECEKAEVDFCDECKEFTLIKGGKL